MSHFVLYVPGLGDHYDTARAFLLRGWRVWGIKARLLSVGWYGAESYEQKLAIVRHAIRDAEKNGYTVTLIGESAGASLVLNAAVGMKRLHRIILIAGVNSSALPISPHLQKRSPLLARSSKEISASLQKLDTRNIHTIRGLRDHVVSHRYDAIKNASTHVIFAFGHFMTIAFCLSIFSGFVAYLTKRK